MFDEQREGKLEHPRQAIPDWRPSNRVWTMPVEDSDKGKSLRFECHLIYDQDQAFEPGREPDRNKQRHPQLQQPRTNVN